jgi:hypothetical protein
MYMKINGSKVIYDGDPENLKRQAWQVWRIDLTSLNVSNVTELSIGFDRIGTVGGQGMILLDAIGLYRVAPAVAKPVSLIENFDSLAVGTDMHDVDGWEGWDGAAGAGAPVSDAFASSGSNSVEIVGTADLVRILDITGGSVTLTAMQYIPSGTTGDTFFILLSKYPVDKEWTAQYKFSLGSGVLTSEQTGGGTADIVYDQWVEIKFVIHLDINSVDEYYNGALVSTRAWSASAQNTLQAIDLYSAGASSVYYDDIVIEFLE